MMASDQAEDQSQLYHELSEEDEEIGEEHRLVQEALNRALIASGLADMHMSSDNDGHSRNDNSKDSSQLQWTDITDRFRESVTCLAQGELIHESSFSLFDAMSAIELTDPKMDAIVQWDRFPGYPHSIREAVTNNQLKLEGHTPSELIGIFDEVLACIGTWLKGHTLAQTVFTCMYLLDHTQSENLFLRAFSIASIRIVDNIRETIARGGVYLEDDQQVISIGLNMLNSFKDETVLATLKAAKDRLVSLLKTPLINASDPSSLVDQPQSIVTKLTQDWDRTYTEALLVRVKFARSLFLLVSNFNQRTRESITLCEQELPLCLSHLDSLISTISLGKPIDPQNPLELGFHPLINQHLLPPSYREYKILPRNESTKLLHATINQMFLIYNVGRLNNLKDLFSAILKLSSVDHSPSVLVRSLISQLCLTNDRSKIFGSKTIECLIKDEVKVLFNPPSLNPRSPLSTSPLANDLVDRFLGNMHLPFVGLMRVYCQHRARQRSMIAKYLNTVCEIQQESEAVDQQLHKLTQQIDPQRQHLSCYCTWFVYYISKLFVDYILLGFEYNLYSQFEMHYVFWYLEYSYGWQQMTLKTAAKLLCQEPQLSGKNKKKSKGKRKDLPRDRELEVVILNVKRSICIGLMRAYEALMLDKKINQPKFEFGSEELIFKNRFLPFSFVLTPQPLSYSDYQELAGIGNYKGSGINLYEAASRHFMSAKASLEELNLAHDKEIDQLLKSVKMNLVIMNIAASGHKKDSTITPSLDFSIHKEFPVLRL